jgi:glycosyltransferase involved in cell wall biosynthesis
MPAHQNIQHQSLAYWGGLLRPGRLFWRLRRDVRINVLSSWINKNQPDIWHSTYFSLPRRWPGPIVINAYDLIYERYAQQYNRVQDDAIRSSMRQAILRADAVICISEATKIDVQRFYDINSTKIVVIPLAASSEFKTYGADELPETGQRPFLLYIGRRAGYKNFETLLAAYSRWSQRKNIDLLVVGSPWTASERQQILALQVADQVNLETDVSDQQLANFYNRAVAFVHPSLYEGFGLPLLEALSCGCPLVASNIPTSMEIAGSTAHYFDPNDIEQILNALDQVVETGRTVSYLEQARKIAAGYSWDYTARKTLEVYHALA